MKLGSFWNKEELKYADLFCGIGGFHLAANNLKKLKCVFACEIDEQCRKSYEANFGIIPFSDIRKIIAKDVPDIDLLMAGFPCQSFSIIGNRKGFSDRHGELFFELVRIIKEKQPKGFLLENVSHLIFHNFGETIKYIFKSLRGLGYFVEYKILNTLDFGLPQNRKRIFIVGFKGHPVRFEWPEKKIPMQPLDDLLEKEVLPEHYVCERVRLRLMRNAVHEMDKKPNHPLIWNQNRTGGIKIHPYSGTLRSSTYSTILVNGERRITPRERLRLQGFPESFKITCNKTQACKQSGNTVSVPVVQAILEKMLCVNE